MPLIDGPSLEDTRFPFQNPYDLRVRVPPLTHYNPPLWMPFTPDIAAPVGWLVVTCDKETARMPFDYKLVKWDGETLTEECGKMYAWAHNPYKTWRFIGDCCDV